MRRMRDMLLYGLRVSEYNVLYSNVVFLLLNLSINKLGVVRGLRVIAASSECGCR